MKTTVCYECGEQYNYKRYELGYATCLDCGDNHAQAEKAYKAKCTAPAFNKGAYQYITSVACVKGIFKCGSTKQGVKTMDRRKSRKTGRYRLTAEDRAKYARERRELIGKLIIQDGWEGAIVLEHVRGSQYIVRLADGREVYASHKKQKDQQKEVVATQAGWRLWEEK